MSRVKRGFFAQRIWTAAAGLVAVVWAALGASPALAQASPSAYTTGLRYDAMHRVVGTIAPDPDGSTGPINYAAVRNTYDGAGRLTKIETGELSTWKSETVSPASWGTAFSVFQTTDILYDSRSRKIKETLSGNGSVQTVTQYSYDLDGNLVCTAVRMNPTGAPPSSVCSQTTPTPADGADRITKNIYDAADELVQVRKGVGVAGLEHAEATYSYRPNGKREYTIDGEGNRAQFTYDDYGRLKQWIFPSSGTPPSGYDDSTPANALATAGSVNTNDFEQYGYDNNGSRTSLRKRDGRTLTFSYDGLDRVTSKIVPDACATGYVCGTLASTAVRDVYYDYDAFGHQLHAMFDALTGPDGITNTYDDFGELTSSTIKMGTVTKSICSTSQPCLFDADGNRTQVTEDGQAFTYAFDGLDRLSGIYEGTSALSTVSIDQFAYNSDGTLHSRTEGATPTPPTVTYGYDGADRLTSQADAFPTNATTAQSNVSWSFQRNGASQIKSETRDNDSYAYSTLVTTSANYAVNGLNQYTTAAGVNYCYDSNGNVTADGSSVYLYDVENRLVQKRAQTSSTCPNGGTGYTGALQTNLTYDALGRLYQVDVGNNATTTVFLYDGDALVGEYNNTGSSLLARYVHGSNLTADDPLVWYTTSNLATRRFLHADHLGSIVAMTNGNNAVLLNKYDEYGIPGTTNTGTVTNTGRFQYTGQSYIPEVGMYYYKARFYSPRLGRFIQTDPVGYDGGINIYAYATDDPIDLIDPSGNLPGYDPLRAEVAEEAYELSGAKDVVSFVQSPSLKNGFWAALAILPFGKVEKAATVSAKVLEGAEAVARRMGITSEMKASVKGAEKGVRWSEKERAVRVMNGNPKAKDAFLREPYVKITGPEGKVYDKGGNVITGSKPGSTPEAHIPVKEFDPSKFKFSQN